MPARVRRFVSAPAVVRAPDVRDATELVDIVAKRSFHVPAGPEVAVVHAGELRRGQRQRGVAVRAGDDQREHGVGHEERPESVPVALRSGRSRDRRVVGRDHRLDRRHVLGAGRSDGPVVRGLGPIGGRRDRRMARRREGRMPGGQRGTILRCGGEHGPRPGDGYRHDHSGDDESPHHGFSCPGLPAGL